MSRAWRQVSTRRWRGFRTWILARDGHACQLRLPGVCIGIATHVDHIVPLSRRPDLLLDPANCRAACAPCNRTRRDIPDDQLPRTAIPSRSW